MVGEKNRPGGLTSREMQVQEEDSSSIRTIPRSHDGSLPVEEVITDRSGAAGRRWVSPEIGQFLRGGQWGEVSLSWVVWVCDRARWGFGDSGTLKVGPHRKGLRPAIKTINDLLRPSNIHPARAASSRHPAFQGNDRSSTHLVGKSSDLPLLIRPISPSNRCPILQNPPPNPGS